MKVINTIVNSIFLVLLLGVAVLFLVPLLPLHQNLQMRIVESGSMEPAIMTGSLVLILPSDSYKVGDVITFKSATANIPTTHRIAKTYTDNGRLWFITKGDANEEADTNAVLSSNVFGKVRLAIPRAGYILDFARKPLGFILLIVLPSLLLIVGEVQKIITELKRRRPPMSGGDSSGGDVGVIPITQSAKQTAVRQRMMDIATPIRYFEYPTLDLRAVSFTPSSVSVPKTTHTWPSVLATVVLGALIASSSLFGSTVSYFNDTESSVANKLQAVELDFTVTPDGSNYSFENGVLTNDEDGALITVVTPTPNSVDTRYDIKTEFKSGNTQFCNAILAKSTSPFIYSGSLTTLQAVDTSFSAPWSVAFTLPDESGLSNGDTCLMDIVFTAWHFEEATNQGYFDEERVPLSFSLVIPQPIQGITAPVFLLTPIDSASTSEASSTNIVVDTSTGTTT